MKQNLILLTVLLTALSAFPATYYVKASRPDNSGAGTNWATAKQSIRAAVKLTKDGDTVLITNGTYSIAAEISVTNAITIRSVNGPAVTVVDGNGSTRCFNLHDSACLISGITVMNGSGWDGAGIHCESQVPCVSNCVITANSFSDAVFSSGGGMYGGTAWNCIFRENDAGDGGGLARGISYNSVFINNTAMARVAAIGFDGYGGGQYGGEAHGCLFINNSASMLGYALASGVAYNCTFIDQTGVTTFDSTIYNSIFSEDAGPYESEVYNSRSSGLLSGINGNINNAPLFVDAANGDFRLQSNSPCVNWGNNSVVSNTTDLDGNPRIVEGTVDMGAYEYQGTVDLADSDADGIHDDWERQHGGNQNPDTVCSNGVNILRQAYIAGLDPNDPQSRFQTSVLRSPSAENILQWQGVSGRVYAVYFSTNLLDGFEPLETNIPWSSGCFTDSVHNAHGQLYYKLNVKLEADSDDSGDPFFPPGGGGGDHPATPI